MNNQIIKALENMGITNLNYLQEETLNKINHHDVFIQAPTGSGKTLSYLLPILDKMDNSNEHTQVIIITPTRELTLQVNEVTSKITPYLNIHNISLIGGLDINKQINALKHRPQLLIATPGRLLDLITQDKLDLSKVKYIVFDEADQIVSTGQSNEVRKILTYCSECTHICVSATYHEFIKELIHDYISIKTIEGNQLNAKITSYYIKTNSKSKNKTLLNILDHSDIKQAIVFTNYKNDANVISEYLNKHDILSQSFSSYFEERDRIKILNEFKKGNIRVLVATDAASRGLDLSDISHIIHYDIPSDYETYIHRSGRSAHQNNDGITITMIKEEDELGNTIINESNQYIIDYDFNNDLSHPLIKEEKTSNITTIKIYAGKKDKIRPKDIIGALCTIYDFKEIGVLEIQDIYSTVTILKPKDEISLDSLSIKGKKRKVVLANS